jgi:hypothetical protein
MGVIVGRVVGDAGLTGMHVRAAQFLGGDDLSDRGLHQRRAAEKDRALVLDDHGFIGHRRHIGAAGGAGAEYGRDLRDAGGRHLRLIVEDAAEMVTVGKNLVLQGQECAAGIHQIDARQMVVARDLLRPQVFLHRHRIIGAAFDGGVIGDNGAGAAAHRADAGDDAGRGDIAAVHVVGGERRQLQERRAGIEQRRNAVAHQKLAAFGVARPGFVRAAARGVRELFTQLLDRAAHRRDVAREVGRLGIDRGLEDGHRQFLKPQPLLNNSRPISMRRISLVPAPIS